MGRGENTHTPVLDSIEGVLVDGGEIGDLEAILSNSLYRNRAVMLHPSVLGGQQLF